MRTFRADVSDAGERLVPGRSHGIAELVRHRSAYLFFKRVIELDGHQDVSVVDLGCGVGHGCLTLAELPGLTVVGIDASATAISYAEAHYSHPRVAYAVEDLRDFIPRMEEFDYIVSRNALEHVPDGLELARRARWRFRLMVDVPYREAPNANAYHKLESIDEEAFSGFSNAELFYEDLYGRIENQQSRPAEPNVIMCIASREDELRVTDLLTFPIEPWIPPRRRDRVRLVVERGAVAAGHARRAIARRWRR